MMIVGHDNSARADPSKDGPARPTGAINQNRADFWRTWPEVGALSNQPIGSRAWPALRPSLSQS